MYKISLASLIQHHHWNMSPRWMKKQQPNKLASSTTNFDTPLFSLLIWRVLPLFCLYLGMPSPDADSPLPHSAVISFSFTFISTPGLFLPELLSHYTPPPTLPLSYFRSYPCSSPYQSPCLITCLLSSWSNMLCIFFLRFLFALFLSYLLWSLPSDITTPIFLMFNFNIYTYSSLWNSLLTRIISTWFTPTS